MDIHVPPEEETGGGGQVIHFAHFGRPRLRGAEDLDRHRAIETRRTELHDLVTAQLAQFAECAPLPIEERDILLEAMNRYLRDPRFSGSLRGGIFRDPVQNSMSGLIEGLKAARNARHALYVKKTADGQIDIAKSLLVLQNQEGLRTLAELFYQRTGANLLLLFVQQLEQGRMRTLYRLRKIENHAHDGWSLLLRPMPGIETTRITVRPKPIQSYGFPSLACFVLLPEVVESNPDKEPEDDPDEPKRA